MYIFLVIVRYIFLILAVGTFLLAFMSSGDSKNSTDKNLKTNLSIFGFIFLLIFIAAPHLGFYQSAYNRNAATGREYSVDGEKPYDIHVLYSGAVNDNTEYGVRTYHTSVSGSMLKVDDDDVNNYFQPEVTKVEFEIKDKGKKIVRRQKIGDSKTNTTYKRIEE